MGRRRPQIHFTREFLEWRPILRHLPQFLHNFPSLILGPRQDLPTGPVIADQFSTVHTEIVDFNL